MVSSNSSTESWMPMETPHGISRRAPPPIFFQSGTPSMRAARSHAAASRPPLAMLWQIGILDAYGDSARNFAPRAAADLFPKRHAFHACGQVPRGGFQAAFGHVVDRK